MKNILYLLIIIIINNDSIIAQKEKLTIVFIHGSYGINLSNVLKIIFYNIFNIKKLKNLFDEIEFLRFNKKLSDHQSICGNKKGLEEIIENKNSHYAYEYVSNSLKNKFTSAFETKDIKYYSFN